MLVEPGFVRTELLTTDSTTYAQPSIDGYAERAKEIVAAWNSMNGKQGGDPAKLADALVRLAALDEPPARFAAGADAVQTFEAKAKVLRAQAAAHRDLSSSLAYDRGCTAEGPGLDADDGSGILELPDELLAQVGWKEGDTLLISQTDSSNLILWRAPER
jgi:hypothetical protein